MLLGLKIKLNIAPLKRYKHKQKGRKTNSALQGLYCVLSFGRIFKKRSKFYDKNYKQKRSL